MGDVLGMAAIMMTIKYDRCLKDAMMMQWDRSFLLQQWWKSIQFPCKRGLAENICQNLFRQLHVFVAFLWFVCLTEVWNFEVQLVTFYSLFLALCWHRSTAMNTSVWKRGSFSGHFDLWKIHGKKWPKTWHLSKCDLQIWHLKVHGKK